MYTQHDCIENGTKGTLQEIRPVNFVKYNKKAEILLATVPPETVNREQNVSLTVHFLYQCHMGFAP